MNHLEGRHYLGPKAWDKLVARWGGSEIFVPASLDSNSGRALAAVVGDRAAQALIDYAGGDVIYVAANWEQTLAARYNAIRDLRDRGMSYGEIARTFTFTGRYTERNIRMILSGDRDAVCQALRQPELPL